MLKKVGFSVAAVALVLASTGCQASSIASNSGSTDGGGQKYESLPYTDILPVDEGAIGGADSDVITIGFSQTCFNHPWRTAMIESAEAEVARHPGVELVVTDGNCDVADQANDVSDLMSRGVDAIILSPVESAGLAPAAKRVMDAGIPLIVLDRDVPAEKTVFVGQSNVEMAYDTAMAMIDDLGGQGKILEITGLSGSSAATDRSAGLRQALEEYPGIEILAVGDGEWVREPAVGVMDDWLTKYDQIDAVFSHAEESSWGAQQAIANAGRCDDGIRHYTHDGSAPGFEWVRDGGFQADGNYSPFIGDIGVRAAILALQGEEITGAEAYDEPGLKLQLPSLPAVVPDNADEWIPNGWGDFETPVDPCA
ncbi:sugar ABC transporter substrate-binding protein [Cryobacterium levicorallinum]|uniref:Ribose transport system substrate-binding protein n=1 Tax=Cryobacterium levicorallinum TaxID=995038 RepID=A0A1I3E4Z6_9MICO|nr:substrate-binding domain-containing protein [Cryobacterium levicorallinum]TFB82420.1 sugar ABC transporter substrate-binding protein [Cryobacterium levicorallinum]GEP28567.1 sugar ABC transporter substrate-binding protein [Cryobacterium levicorallinum]SFH94060.1 ribose transport system substrate-binding protein [Cryobacterium levicorallinum]